MTAHVPRFSVSLDPQVSEARRRGKRRRNLVAAVVLAAVASGLTLGLHGSNHPGGAPLGRGGSVSRWQGDNLRVMYPRSWHVTTRSLTAITQPVQRFAIYSGRRPRPMAAPKPNQVIGLVMEQTALAPGDLLREFPRRPTYFALTPPFSVEGFSGSWGEIIFRDHRRAFYLFVGVGAHAQPQLPRLLAALDTLRVGT
jgi:hypothetical protein